MKNHFFVWKWKRCLMIALIAISLVSFLLKESLVETVSAKRLLPIYSVSCEDMKVSLTFDSAWGAEDIEQIVDTLNRNDIQACFFTVGTWVEKNPEAVRVLSENGMEIGNHSNSHAHVGKMNYEENVEDMKKCNEKISAITGGKVRFYRGAYGEYSNEVIQAASSLDMQVIQWDIDTLDYTGKTVDEMCKRIQTKIRNGSIILMHNDTKYTAEGLQQIIDTIKELGYEIVPLSELVYEDNYEINHEGRQFLR